MAKIQAPQKNGSVGTSTFLSTPHGLIERQRARPRNPRTLAQQHIRGLVRAYAAKWRQLDDATRAGWRALASQLPGHLNGFNAYSKVNVTLANCGLPEPAAAPALPLFGRLLCTGLVVDASPNITLRGLSNTLAPDAVIVEACPPLSAGISFVGRCWRQLGALPGHAGPGQDVDLTGAYLLRFPAPGAGQRLWVRLAAMTHGIRDEPVEFTALVGPGAASGPAPS